MPTRDVPSGIYRHWKGSLYQVLGLAHDANADEFFMDNGYVLFEDERVVVVYIGLELDAAHLGPRLAVRTLDDFVAEVHDPESGKLVPRFKYLGSMLTADMLNV